MTFYLFIPFGLVFETGSYVLWADIKLTLELVVPMGSRASSVGHHSQPNCPDVYPFVYAH